MELIKDGIASPVATIRDINERLSGNGGSAAYIHPETHPAEMITGLAPVATSGSYNDLTEKPEPPSQTIDITGNLDKHVPPQTLVLRPTSAAFDTFMSSLLIISTNYERWTIILFSNFNDILNLCGFNLPSDIEPGPGMWVLTMQNVNNIESLFTLHQAIRVTDGTNILIPEVRLSELLDDELKTFVITGYNIIFQGNVSDENNPILTAIDGCEFFFRMTPAQAMECAWKKADAALMAPYMMPVDSE